MPPRKQLTPSQLDTTPATEAHMRNAAIRAVDDPAKLAQAARIVTAALERGRLRLADLTPPASGARKAAGQ
jgi:hypothetical protein